MASKKNSLYYDDYMNIRQLVENNELTIGKKLTNEIIVALDNLCKKIEEVEKENKKVWLLIDKINADLEKELERGG